MKAYEKDERCIPLLPVIARLDGKAFHSFTHNFKKPFCDLLHDVFVSCTRQLVEDTGARIGYTQSDEISLVFYSDNFDSQIFFDGKFEKMNSVLTSMLTYHFNERINLFQPVNKPAFFDCRVFQVPNLKEVANYLIWREEDAVRNSIQSLARAHFSHNECNNLTKKQLQEKLWQKEKINWNDLPSWAKRGTYIFKRKKWIKLTDEELEKIPKEHRPEGPVERTIVEEKEIPPLRRITNRVEVLFDNCTPVTEEQEEPVLVFGKEI